MLLKNGMFLLFILSFFNLLVHADANIAQNMDGELMIEILAKLKRGENIIFTKYGDGEYLCMMEHPGTNIDGDARHPDLGKALRNALLSLSQKPNTYIGRWHDGEQYRHIGIACDTFAREHNVQVPWVNYHLFMNDDTFNVHNYLHAFVDFVQTTHRKKIVIFNGANKRLFHLFKADVFIEIPPRNWSYNYEYWKTLIQSHIEKDCILLIGGGTCAKVLIDDITNSYDCTCIDLGSSFDMLASKKNTRGWQHNYSDEVRYYKDLLPENWESIS